MALSRARLGLYVFCRQSLFQGHRELVPAMSKLVRNHSTKNSGEARRFVAEISLSFSLHICDVCMAYLDVDLIIGCLSQYAAACGAGVPPYRAGCASLSSAGAGVCGRGRGHGTVSLRVGQESETLVCF